MGVLEDGVMAAVIGRRADVDALLFGDFFRADQARRNSRCAPRRWRNRKDARRQLRSVTRGAAVSISGSGDALEEMGTGEAIDGDILYRGEERGQKRGWHSRDAAANNATLWLQGDFNLPQNRM